MNENRNKVARNNPNKTTRNKKDTSKGKNGKSNSYTDAQFEKVMHSEKTRGSNDISWYANSPELLRAAASLSFNTPVGDRNPINADFISVPGVCALRWNPSIQFDAVNQAANSMYSYVVHANSRNYSYDPADLMMLVLAGASLFSLIAHGIRAYGTMQRFNGLDKYTPSVLIHAMGFDYDDLRSNLNRMWFDLNEIINRVTQIWIPNTMPILQRWFWMNTNIYRDSDSVKAQYYLFTPGTFYELSEIGSETGTSLTAHEWPYTPQKWDYYIGWINRLTNSLLNSEDRGIIFGDLLKAYGAEQLYAIRPIESNFTIEPVCDKEVLSQIENASITDLAVGDIQQDATGKIYQSGVWKTEADWDKECIFRTDHEVLNFHQKEAPTPEQVMIATRLKAMGTRQVGESTDEKGVVSKSYLPYTSGTEFIKSVTMYALEYGSANGPKIQDYGFSPYSWNKLFSAKYMYIWDCFDWRPMIYKCTQRPSSETGVANVAWYGYSPLFVGDVDNYTFITDNELRKMHLAATYSEFGIPQM